MSASNGRTDHLMKKGRLLGALLTTLALLGLATAAPVGAAAGDLDSSFDGEGVSRWHVDIKQEVAITVGVQDDGKIVTAGEYTIPEEFSGDRDWFVSRHHPNGSLDESFGVGGTVTTPMPGNFTQPRGVAFQDDGKIVLAGYTGLEDTAIVRYHTDGSLDTSFGGTGIVILNLSPTRNDRANAVAVEPGGRIIVAGNAPPGPGFAFSVAAVNSDGTLDTTFGGGAGFTTTSFVGAGGASGGVANGLSLQTDGRIVVAGESGGNFALARYTSNGALDTTFSGDGKLTTDFGGTADAALDVAVDANDRIVAAGFGSTSKYLALTRYTSTGALDTTFSGDGKTTTNKLVRSSRALVYNIGLAIQVDGKPVVGGGFDGLGGGDFGAARFNVAGSLDSTFSGDGVARFDLSATHDFGNDVAIDASGNIVIAGGVDSSVQNPDGSHDGEAMLVRFLGDLADSACPGMTIDNIITGTPGDDALVGTAGSDFIIGGDGNDTITGADGDDCIYGGTGNDVLDGGDGNDRLFSESGNDTITGGLGLDKVVAQVGNDVIRIAAGDVPEASTEVSKGKKGNDTAELGAGLTAANVSGSSPTFTVADPVTGGTYSLLQTEAISDT